jgi:hypothetical protein
MEYCASFHRAGRDRQENTKNKLKDKNLYPLRSWRPRLPDGQVGEMKKEVFLR